ncbi:ABC transporter ATP-binding protein [Saccharopolyspora sp. WRP15-2]|uniref:ABC transporter ATP-binding protein n=2 Tax=Saccharopolyspora oryzae TaxID=2997343 RepID=A0ABT4VCD3_9PSEU|nr:ABC transporter ATP-binding protein [Saccharopolyspora oryzae]MDA3631066.1 ABC transporter ATP-binding protein [Saccharopolyspora oryzae]
MLEVSGLGHRYGGANGHQAIADLTFQVRTGELACIVGPSGCGKSTMLRSISGLIKPTDGQVKLKGNPVQGVPEDLAVVFQDYSRSLFPWLSVRSNVEFPLRSRGVSKAERRERADEVLEWVGLSAAAKKYPWQLSGGMQQRVSIARALACRPALLLMDEPFASVDAQTRFELEDLLLRVRKQFDSTVLLVTHDIDESIYLADRVFVLSKSPATVVSDLEIPLGDERDQITTRESETFVHLRSEVARLLDVRTATTAKPAEPEPKAEASAEAGAEAPAEAEPKAEAPTEGSAEAADAAESDVDESAKSTAEQWTEAEKAEQAESAKRG